VPAYDEIRDAISRGPYLDDLRLIEDSSLKIIREGAPKHPAVFFVLATLARRGVEAWGEDEVIPANAADDIGSQLKPHLNALLAIADGNANDVCAVLDAVTATFFRGI
jgi:hypothetical protein